MALRIKREAPNLTAETNQGKINFQEWIGNGWARVLYQPKTFTPVFTAENATVRSVFDIGPDKKVKAMLTYPMSTGRNFDEVLRLLDSCQLTAKHKVATPVNWKQGEDVIIVPAVSDADAKQAYPGGWKAPKPYIRIVPQPR